MENLKENVINVYWAILTFHQKIKSENTFFYKYQTVFMKDRILLKTTFSAEKQFHWAFFNHL